jgi:hypothetical protein
MKKIGNGVCHLSVGKTALTVRGADNSCERSDAQQEFYYV